MPTTGRSSRARDTALVAVFAALIAALGVPGMLTLFGNAVPITLQTLGVMLAGSILGAKRGAAAVAVFLALVAAGLPLLAGGRSGAAVFVGPSAGYLVGFLAGAFAIGVLVQVQAPRVSFPRLLAANALGGIVVIYAFGVPIQALVTGTSLHAAAVAALTFVPGDAIKAVVAASVAAAVHRAVPDVAPTPLRERSRV